MSPANLDLVRSIYADWEQGDFSSVDWADPEIEFMIAGGLAPGRRVGLVGMPEGSGGHLNCRGIGVLHGASQSSLYPVRLGPHAAANVRNRQLGGGRSAHRRCPSV